MRLQQLPASDLLSKRQTNTLKGLFVSMVLISHLHGRVELFSHSLLGTMFSAFGYLAVSGFFFVSGYGLYRGYQEKENYIDSFPRKKILPYYVMCISVFLLYFIRDFLIGDVNWLKLLQSFFFGGSVVDMGWYLQAQLVLYLAFYFAFRFFKHGICCVAVFSVLYCVICAAWGLPTTWYESIWCFTLGLLCAKYKKDIVWFLEGKKRAVLSACVFAAVFVVMLFLGNKTILPEPLRILAKMLSACCFVSVAALAYSFIHKDIPVLDFLGKRSFAMYVLQGMVLQGCRIIIESDWLYMLVVTGITLAAAVVMQPVFNQINRRIASI